MVAVSVFLLVGLVESPTILPSYPYHIHIFAFRIAVHCWLHVCISVGEARLTPRSWPDSNVCNPILITYHQDTMVLIGDQITYLGR